jgi:hypothetical protein
MIRRVDDQSFERCDGSIELRIEMIGVIITRILIEIRKRTQTASLILFRVVRAAPFSIGSLHHNRRHTVTGEGKEIVDLQRTGLPFFISSIEVNA